MGTKNNPGSFDCYKAAEPDEPMFVLLARDRSAACLVNLWATMRRIEGTAPDKVDEAARCADSMVDWLLARPDLKRPQGIATLARGLTVLAEQCGATIDITPSEAGFHNVVVRPRPEGPCR